MTTSVLSDLVTVSLSEARTRARELQLAGFGLEHAEVVDGGGYQFVYVDSKTRAMVMTLLIPDTSRDEPGYVVARRSWHEPLWGRIVSETMFSTRTEAAEVVFYQFSADTHEVVPHIDVLDFTDTIN